MAESLQILIQRALETGNPVDISAVGDGWASGLSTRTVDQQAARLLVDRGAPLSVHAAAGLGFTDHLARMLAADPALIDAKGCDACTPLHFARDVSTAKLLLDHGARIDARDEDHGSTPAQWSIGDAPEVARFLLERGATADIFLAAALGDLALAQRLVQADPSCVAYRIGKLPFPPLGHEHRGGTIYQWTLAFNSYAHQIALKKGHPELFDFLYEHSDDAIKLIVSCLLGRREQAESIAAQHPGLVASLPPEDHELVARYCWETNTDYDAVKLMLDVGFPVAHPEHSHGFTPLHNAAWAGSADLVDLLIERGHPIDIVDPRYDATPLGYALHDCLIEKRHPEGDFGRIAKSLLDAGAHWDPLEYPTGDPRIDAVFRSYLDGLVGAALLGDEAGVFQMLGAHPTGNQLADALAGSAKGGHLALARRLLDVGAPIDNVTGRDVQTPLMYALAGGSQDMVGLLLDRGAGVDAKNRYGTLALHFAVGFGASIETITRLLESGAAAHIETPNAHGRTPLTVASDRGRPDVAKFLQEYKTRL